MSYSLLPIESLLKLIASDIEKCAIAADSIAQCDHFYSEISKAYTYPLQAGGKRIRPLLTLLCAGALGGSEALEVAQKSALAIEKIHTYSLVHDDLPCMDNDDLRRGLPTTHKVYGEAKALLVGDALLTEAFSLLAKTVWHKNQNALYLSHLIEDLAEGAGASGMIWGQWLDISLTGATHVTWEQMECVHKNKTGKLLGSCLALGGICGISTWEQTISQQDLYSFRKKMKEAGVFIGLSFQIRDDILDATKTNEELGKTAGKDEIQNKFTAVKLLGIEKAEEMSLFYTEKSINLLNEIFSHPFLKTLNKDHSHYQKLLISQIKQLLSREN
ncbi:polyprenyl synthetase family protein [Silvanigrella aquatica]|uniref:Polyprenyl synthetase n=1 Tax=Silvanigrella aquatica TaxID=1915309 RepID=A0A1L4D1V7_9BACT|nr:polyprenyl synthetase family protein [Silvanigrella aquatica]APJ04174.1 hypothetical protein AXG55_09765 [Silvanigrella aquatica]